MAQSIRRSEAYSAYDFSGGVNKKTSPVLLLPKELSDAQNVLPATRGSITRRYGFTKYHDTEISASKAITGLAKFYRQDGAGHAIIAASGTKLWEVATTGASQDLGDVTDKETAYAIDDGTDVYIAQYRDRLYGTARGGTNHKCFVVSDDLIDGTDIVAWEMGVHPPTNAVLSEFLNEVGNVAEGHFRHDHAYRYGPNAAYGQSNAKEASTVHVTTASRKIRVQIWGTGRDYADWNAAHDAGIYDVYLYRTKVEATTADAEAAVSYFLASVGSADTYVESDETYYEDNTADADLDTTTAVNTDNYPNDKAKYLCLHQDRMFMGNLDDGVDEFPWRIRWSLAGYPDIWPADNYVDAPAEHGHITGLFILGGTLYVAFESAIARLVVHFGPESSFEIVDGTAGVKAPRSLAVGMDGATPCAFFLAADHKVYRFNGGTSRVVSSDVTPVLEGDANQSAMDTCAGGWDGEYYHLSYPYDTASVPDRELRYNAFVRKFDERLQYDTGTWWPQAYPTTYSPGIYLRLTGASDAGELLWGNAAATSWIFTANSGNSDNGETITSFMQSGYWSLGLPGWQKRARKLLFDMETFPRLSLIWHTDFGQSSGQFLVPDDTDVPVYDGPWYYDVNAYYVGDTPNRSERYFAGREDFVWIRFKVYAEEADTPYTVYGWTLLYGIARED